MKPGIHEVTKETVIHCGVSSVWIWNGKGFSLLCVSIQDRMFAEEIRPVVRTRDCKVVAEAFYAKALKRVTRR